MNTALIPILTDQSGKPTVDARSLHEFLQVKTRVSDWLHRRISEYGFMENTDYVTLKKEKGDFTTFSPIEYHLSIEMAKELSMVERNEKGKQARRYFIECEKQRNEIEIVKKPIKSPSRAKVASDLVANHRIAKFFGLEGNQALLSANTMTAKQHKDFGVNPLIESGIELVSEKQIQYFTPTGLGNQAGGISANKINKMLKDAGMQEETRGPKNKLTWSVTGAGKPFCQLIDTAKIHNGAPIMQVKWSADVLEQFCPGD